MELELSVGKLTDVGATRDHNEDCFIVHEPIYPQDWSVKGRLYAVADGMGGHAAGEVASHYAVERLKQLYFSSAYEGDLRWRLVECVRRVNHELHQQVSEKKGRAKMGTTLVCAVVRGEMLYVANVGDSRAYLIRGGVIRPLTRDHSLVAEFIEAGTVAPEDAGKHPQRSVLTRALGTQPEVEVDTFEEKLQRGDTVVLCSDGLWGEVSDEEIRAMATQSDPQTAVLRLVDSANRNGGADNITVIVLRVGEIAAPTLRVAPVAELQRPKRRVGLIVAVLGLVVFLLLLSLGAFLFVRTDFGMDLMAPLIGRARPTPTPSLPAPPATASEPLPPPATAEPTMPVVASPGPTSTPTVPSMPTIPTDTPTISGGLTTQPTRTPDSGPTLPATAAPLPSPQVTAVPPPIPTIVPTEAPQATASPTFITAPTSIALTAPTATSTPSLAPVVLLPTPTSTPTPVALTYQAPLLRSPPDRAVFEGGPEAEIKLEWAPVGRLAPDEYYEVTVTYLERGQERSWRGETKWPFLQLPWIVGAGRADNDLFYWSVGVRRKSGGPGQERPAVSPRSEVREFTWRIMPTPTATRTLTPTFTPTSAPKPPSLLPTLTPTSAPTSPLPTATAEPTLEATPTFAIILPTSPAPGPVLLEPAENFRTDGSSVPLTWDWSEGLDEGEYFDVQIRPKGQTDSVFVDWTRERTYELKKWSTWQPGEYTWTIAIIHGHYDSSGEKVFEKDLGLTSEARLFRWDAGGQAEEEGGGGGPWK